MTQCANMSVAIRTNQEPSKCWCLCPGQEQVAARFQDVPGSRGKLLDPRGGLRTTEKNI